MVPALFGYELRGGVPLRRVRPAGPETLGWLRLEAVDPARLRSDGELLCSVETPASRVAVWRAGVGVLVSCSLTGSYLLDPLHRQVTFDGRPGDDAWEHRLVSTILPLLLVELGELALHACAVAGPDGAVLFCGPSGRGKSTAAAALGVRGHAVLADDVTVIADVAESPVVWPGPAGVVVAGHVPSALGGGAGRFDSWDMGDLRRRSVYFPAGADTCVRPCRVCAVVLLSERRSDRAPAPPQLEILDPVSALAALMGSAVHIGDVQRRQTMHRLARLVERVPVYRAALADRLDLAADQAQAVTEMAGWPDVVIAG